MTTYSGKWHLSVFPSETLGLILSFVDLWSVARLFCGGSKQLNKNLLSTSGVRHVELLNRKYLTISLPRVMTEMKGLTSVRLVSKESAGEFSPSSLDIMGSLPVMLESLTIKGFYNVSNVLMRPKSSLRGTRSTVESCYPNLTSLVIFADDEEMVDIHKNFFANLPPNLTKLQLPSAPQKFLGLLPTGLVELKLASLEMQLLGAWISKLPSLTKLQLSIFERLSFDEDGIKKLPRGLTWLSFGVTPEVLLIKKGKRRSDEVEDLNASAKFIFENLPEHLLHFDSCIQYESQDVARLSCWASLKSMVFAEIDGVKLPPNLTSLTITTYPSDDSVATIRAFPVGLTKLIWDTWDPNPEELSLLPTSLTLLNCGDFSDSHLHLLPPSLIHFECRPVVPDTDEQVVEQISGLKPFLERLPKVVLKTFNALDGWGWVRVKDLGKFVYMNMRGATLDDSQMVTDRTDSSQQSIFSGIGGSGWTCLGQAIELDNPELAEDILNLNSRLEYQLYNHEHLLLAVKLGSINILKWFKTKGALSFFREYELKQTNENALLVAFKEKHNAISEWLTAQGFTVSLGNEDTNLIELAIRRDSVNALAWALNLKETLLAKQERGETLSEQEEAQLARMVESPTPHTLALIHNSSDCWTYLMETLPLRKWPDRDPRLLSPDIDLFAILENQFLYGFSVWVFFIGDRLISHDDAIKNQANKDGSKSKKKAKDGRKSKGEESDGQESNGKPKGKGSDAKSSSKGKKAPKSKDSTKPLKKDITHMSIADCVVQAIVDSKQGSLRGVRRILKALQAAGVVLFTSPASQSLVTACAQLALRDADTEFTDDDDDDIYDEIVDELDRSDDQNSQNSDLGDEDMDNSHNSNEDESDNSSSNSDQSDISGLSAAAHDAITKLFEWLHAQGCDVWDIKGMGGRKKYTIQQLADASGCGKLSQAIAAGKFQPLNKD